MVISNTGSLFMPVLQNMDYDSHIGSALFLLLTVKMKAVISSRKRCSFSFTDYMFSSMLTGRLLDIKKF